MSWYRQQLEDWLSKLNVKADTVLDIGGAQGLVKGRVKSWDVKNYEVFDLPKDVQEDTIGFEVADIIFCLEVFEYLIRPLEALCNIQAALKSGSKAYITFAFVYPLHQEVELDSLRYTETGIKKLADQAGLTVTNIWYRHDKSQLLTMFYGADGMHPAKGYDHSVTGYIVEFKK